MKEPRKGFFLCIVFVICYNKNKYNFKGVGMPQTKVRVKAQTNNETIFGKIWRIALAIAIPLGGGFIVSSFTRDAMGKFGDLNQPPLAPPAWLFPVAWTILYILMGLASYLIYRKTKIGKNGEKVVAKSALMVYAVQLIFNFAWTPVFFNAEKYWLALVILLAMWVLEIVLIVKAKKLNRAAFWCLLPYLLWTTFAAYLNISIAILN